MMNQVTYYLKDKIKKDLKFDNNDLKKIIIIILCN